jgi:LPS-assembly protein
MMRFRLLGQLAILPLGAWMDMSFAQTAPDVPPGATTVTADRISGRNEVETKAEGNAAFQRNGLTIKTDLLIYRQLDDEAEAIGNVRMMHAGDYISGPHLKLKVQDNLGTFEQPEFSFKRTPRVVPDLDYQPRTIIGSGQAERVDLEGNDLYRFTRGTFSTCSPQRDWYISAEEITLDYNREMGRAEGGKVVFLGVPIFYWPHLSFSLNQQRASGFLPPTYGQTTTSGLEFTQPWYWNIAPNMDATIAPRILTRRGVQLNTDFRYLTQDYRGESTFAYLPGDALTHTNRSAYSVIHTQNFGHGFSGDINASGASDNQYFTDLSSSAALVSQTNLLQQGRVKYSGNGWNAGVTMQRYQTLQDPNAPVVSPYYLLPQLWLSGEQLNLPGGFNFQFSGEYVDFEHPTLVTAQRVVLYPQLALPIQTAGFHITPKIGLHLTHYDLNGQDPGTPKTISRTVPITSIDSGMVFEREADWFGKAMTQTLEPRLYYLNIPVREQSKIPLFDTGLNDFNFAQIFSENRYAGADRIGDANQLTAAVTSRLIDPASGSELLRFALGQRYYLRDEQVVLLQQTTTTPRASDLLAAFSGHIARKMTLDADWEYSPSLSQTQRINAGVHWQPEFGKVLNASYRYTRDQIEQVDLSGQWPLGKGWYGVGRYNYSFRDRQLVEGLAGVEYDAGCWTLRFVLHRLATATTTTSTGIFIQLELNGLAKIGSNPIDLLKRNIAGYGVISQPAADPFFGSH